MAPVFELPGGVGVGGSTPNCFLNPTNTLSNYVLGVSYILHTYDLYYNFNRALTVEKFNPPSYFFTIQTLDGPHALCPYACKFEIISVISIFLLLVEATEVLFSASSLSFFLRNTITHESLNLAW